MTLCLDRMELRDHREKKPIEILKEPLGLDIIENQIKWEDHNVRMKEI